MDHSADPVTPMLPEAAAISPYSGIVKKRLYLRPPSSSLHQAFIFFWDKQLLNVEIYLHKESTTCINVTVCNVSLCEAGG
jgi:hypothetical protein